MNELEPTDNITRTLISTSTRLVGEYKHEKLLISHAWPVRMPYAETMIRESPISQTYYVVSTSLGDFLFCDFVCICLSILYGKRFDNHGDLQSGNLFRLPDIRNTTPRQYPKAPINNFSPRKDLGIELNLSEIKRIENLFFGEFPDQKFKNILKTAGSFYWQSLQIVEQQPESAFLNLVTCGEVLSSYYDYELDDLIEENMKVIFQKIQDEIEDGPKIVKQLKSNLLLVKKKYTKTIVLLLNDYFFSNTECHDSFPLDAKTNVPIGSLKKKEIERRIKAAYDLRSQYVHTGIAFGNEVTFSPSEIQLGKIVGKPSKFMKAMMQSPTFWGLERIMRYCLLRFIQSEGGVPIDKRLDDQTGFPLKS